MKQTFNFATLMLVILIQAAVATVEAGELRVVSSIRPVYFLTSAIMQGTGKPELLLTAQQSPHHYHLQPSQLLMLNQADVVFWIGPTLESTLSKPIDNLKASSYHKPLLQLPDLNRLEFSSSGNKPAGPGHNHGKINPHIWLELNNSIVIAREISHTLSVLDPENSQHYQHNLNKLENELQALKNEIDHTLESQKNSKLLAMHDAWSYFTHEFYLPGYSAIEADGLKQLGARSFYQLKKKVGSNQLDCIIYGPETNQKKLRELAADSEINLLLVDPMAFGLPLTTSFADYLKQIAQTISRCNSLNPE